MIFISGNESFGKIIRQYIGEDLYLTFSNLFISYKFYALVTMNRLL